MSHAESVVVVAGGTADADPERLRTRIAAAAADVEVVTVDVRGALSPAALDVLVDAGRRLGSRNGCLMLAGVDPALARRIAERGDTGVFAVVSPRVSR